MTLPPKARGEDNFSGLLAIPDLRKPVSLMRHSSFSPHSNYINQQELTKTQNGFVIQTSGRENKVSGKANAGQLYPQIIGQEVDAAGDAFELTSNAIVRLRCIKKRLDPARSLL